MRETPAHSSLSVPLGLGGIRDRVPLRGGSSGLLQPDEHSEGHTNGNNEQDNNHGRASRDDGGQIVPLERVA